MAAVRIEEKCGGDGKVSFSLTVDGKPLPCLIQRYVLSHLAGDAQPTLLLELVDITDLVVVADDCEVIESRPVSLSEE